MYVGVIMPSISGSFQATCFISIFYKAVIQLHNYINEWSIVMTSYRSCGRFFRMLWHVWLLAVERMMISLYGFKGEIFSKHNSV
jgi:hypothetical protein